MVITWRNEVGQIDQPKSKIFFPSDSGRMEITWKNEVGQTDQPKSKIFSLVILAEWKSLGGTR